MEFLGFLGLLGLLACVGIVGGFLSIFRMRDLSDRLDNIERELTNVRYQLKDRESAAASPARQLDELRGRRASRSRS